MQTQPTEAPGATAAAGAVPATAATPADPASRGAQFAQALAREMKRIASHASKVETLRNGAKLYFLAGGREVEQALGRTPYVVKPGSWPPPATPKAEPPAPTTATPSPTKGP